MSKLPTVLTGLRVNNNLHIGNYLGALLPMIDFANKNADSYQINLFVPDLHSITTPIAYKELQGSLIDTVRTYIALGLPVGHQNVHVYRQSYISAHSELAWILSCFTGFGQMQRMTQFKDKSQDITSRALKEETELAEVSEGQAFDDGALTKDAGKGVSVGLFNYPILMAADILLYDASYVPVGDDQAQHLEFTRDIAQKMNHSFDEGLFVVPESVKKQHEFFGKDKGLRIRDLVDPTKKMSKSDETGKGVLFLTDSPEKAHKKIMSATTDSLGEVQYDYDTRPGVSNLLDILQLFGGDGEAFMGQNQYGPLKQATSDVITSFLADFSKKMQEIKPEAAIELLEKSERVLSPLTEEKLHTIQKRVGLRSSQ